MRNILVADFETTLDFENPEVYSWGIKGENYNNFEMKYGIDIESFLEETKRFDKDYIMYFHNLGKFDGHFIIPQLHKLGYTQKMFMHSKKAIKVLETSSYKEANITEDRQLLKENEYELLVDKNKKIIEIKIGLPATKTRKGKVMNRIISIRDSLLLFRGSIASFGETLNKLHNTDKYSKLDLDSGYTRNEKYNTIEELENDGNELEYLERDLDVLYKYLEEQSKEVAVNKWKLTAASTSYNQWIEIFGDELIEKNIESGLIEKVIPSNATVESGFYKLRYVGKEKLYNTMFMKKKLIKHYFPTTWLNKTTDNHTIVSQDIYKFFFGGMTHVHPDKKGIIFQDEKLIKVDVNSSYPSVMRYKDLPHGAPYHGDGGDKYPIKFLRITSKTEIKNPKGLPFLPIGNGMSWEYRRIIPKGQDFYIPSFVYDRVKKYYIGEWEEEVIMSFRSINGEKIFGSYIDFWNEKKMQGKETNNPIQTANSKDRLNTIFGKFATRTEMESSIWNPQEAEWERESVINKTDFYLPLAICITAYARMYLVDAVDYNYKYFVYEDTDSIVWLERFKDKLNIQYHPTKLGYWDIEEENASGVFRRPKQYMIITKEKVNIKYAGMNIKDPEKITYEDFLYGHIVPNQKKPMKTPTGVVILDINKEIKPVWEYKKTYDDWFTNEDTFFTNYELQINKIQKELI